jgi:chromodomain-helicase-DNA-binding protein 4
LVSLASAFFKLRFDVRLTEFFSLSSQVQEFEQINGYYSVPELIRKPVDPVKTDAPSAVAASADKNANKDAPTASAATNTDKDAAKEGSGSAEAPKDGEKAPEKEVRLR